MDDVSKALVNRYGKNTLFVVEDLTGIRGATKKVRKRDRYESDFLLVVGYGYKK